MISQSPKVLSSKTSRWQRARKSLASCRERMCIGFGLLCLRNGYILLAVGIYGLAMNRSEVKLVSARDWKGDIYNDGGEVEKGAIYNDRGM